MIRVERDQLAAAVAFAQRGLAKTAVHPALAGIRLTSAKKCLTVSAFDYDVHAQAEAVSTGPDLDLLLPGTLLAKYVGGLPDGEVEISEDGTLGVGRTRVTLHPLASAEYPSTPDRPDPIGEVEAEELAAAFESVRECVDTKAPKKEMTGVSLVPGTPEALWVAGLNNFRMACRAFNFDGETDKRVVVPLHVLDAAKSMHGTVRLGLSDNLISLSDNHRSITGRLIAEAPPNFERLFVIEPTLEVTLARTVLIDALKFVVLGDTRKEVAGHLILDIGTDAVTVALEGVETLDATVDVEAKIEGEPLRVKLKAGYLLNGLNATDADEVRLGFQDARKSFRMQVDSDPTLRFVCMPVRVS